jgi:drug/metabolite transporter (DMT)-like permease
VSEAAPSPLKALLLTALLCLIWGSTWVVIKSGLDDLPALGSAAARFTLAAAAMSVVALAFAEREGGARPTLALTLVLGGLNFAISYGIVYWTEARLPSALVSVLWAVYPLFQAVSGHLFLPGERLAPAQGLGFGLGFLGVTALFATDLRDLGPEAIPAGAVLLCSPLVSALGTTFVKKHGAGTSSILLNRNGMWVGAVGLWVAALASERGSGFRWTGSALFSVAYLALVGTVVAFGLYFWLLRHTPANRLSVIAYVTPAVALLLGALVRQEPIGPWTLTGLGGILAGVYLVHRGGTRARARVAGAAASS